MSAEISIFDDIRHDDINREFWSARELQKNIGVCQLGKISKCHQTSSKIFLIKRNNKILQHK